jgi:hypothetical protein
MLDSEALGRWRRHFRTFARDVAADDGRGLAQALDLMTVLGDDLADSVSDLRDAGYSWYELARELGVARPSARERFGCAPRRAELDRFRRRVTWSTPDGARVDPGGRLSTVGRFVVAAPKGLPWGIVRRCGTAAEAGQLAEWLAAPYPVDGSQGWRFIRRPKDVGELARRIELGEELAAVNA